ncbi:hypothetical protein MQK74_08975 [Vibrio cholerae]|nr:hypothetical protein [Vibrio cholerae]MCU4220459.1 hypothetical protein [Vibrio cholerae]
MNKTVQKHSKIEQMSVRNLRDNHKKPWLYECYPQAHEGKLATKGETSAYENIIMREVNNKK